MYDGIQAYGGIKGLGAIAAMYFIILFTLTMKRQIKVGLFVLTLLIKLY